MQTERMLVAATRRLLASTPSPALGVRGIAAEAGVSHSLVGRHFGSKDALIRRARAEVATEWSAAVDAAAPVDAVRAAFAHLLADPGSARVLAMAVAHSDTGPFPTADALVGQIRTLHPSAEVDVVAVAVTMTIMVGWARRGHLRADRRTRPRR